MRPLVRLALAGFALVAVVPAFAAAQGGPVPGGRCIIEFEGSQGANITRTNLIKLPTGKYNAYIGGHAVGHCQGQDVTLQADSAEYYGDQRLLYLIGNVHYSEPRAKVDAQHMTYWMDEEHLRAEGSVFAVMTSGTTMRGPVADYYRAVVPIRTQAMLVATGRPIVDAVETDSLTGKPSDTVHVVADRITSIADSLVYAGGDVHLTRPDLLATGDSAFVDQGTGLARLMIKPTVEARRDHPFTLTGGVIDVYSQNRQVNRVVATPNGHATSQDLQLFADSVDMRVAANQLQRAYAWGKTRARATSPDRDIIADSIDAVLPEQRLQQIRAVGSVYATSIPDTLTVHTRERDWIRGDTLIATFDTAATARPSARPAGAPSTAVATATPARAPVRAAAQGTRTASTASAPSTTPAARDTAGRPVVKLVVARNRASALYHIKASNEKETRPGVNYVRGRVIDIAFDSGAVSTVTVLDQAAGMYMEPSDTTQAAPKTPRRSQPAPRPTAPRIPGRRSGGT